MGNLITRTFDTAVHPDLNPEPYGPTTFDPTLGIGPRKERGNNSNLYLNVSYV